MPGFDNNTMWANNVDFRGVDPVVGQFTSNGQLLIGSTVAPNIRIGTLTSTDGSVTITTGAGTINLSVPAPVTDFIWKNVGASGALLVKQGFICNAGAALSFSLPAVSAVGDVVAIALDGATSWTITQAANQQIRVGAFQTSVGIGGSLASTAQGDSVMLVCKTANLLWTAVTGVIGNLNIV